MRNNPFLKSKESNNRFSSLQDDNKSYFKESSNKYNIKNNEYESAQNTFKQSSKHEITREPDSIFNRRHDNFHKFTKYKPKESLPLPKGPDITDINLFPELTPIKENITTSKNELSPRFKYILKNLVQEEKPKEKHIPTDFTKISLVNRKTVIEYEQPITTMIKQQKLEKQQEDDTNYIMFKAIESMKKNWERYEQEYDEIHGDGSYIERFILPPIYKHTYDTDTDIETETEDKEEEHEDFY